MAVESHKTILWPWRRKKQKKCPIVHSTGNLTLTIHSPPKKTFPGAILDPVLRYQKWAVDIISIYIHWACILVRPRNQIKASQVQVQGKSTSVQCAWIKVLGARNKGRSKGQSRFTEDIENGHPTWSATSSQCVWNLKAQVHIILTLLGMKWLSRSPRQGNNSIPWKWYPQKDSKIFLYLPLQSYFLRYKGGIIQ